MRIACCAIVLLYACLPFFDADINFFKLSVIISLIGHFFLQFLWGGDDGGGDDGINADNDCNEETAISCELENSRSLLVNAIDDTCDDIVGVAVLVDDPVFDVLVVVGGDGEDIKDVVIDVSACGMIPSSYI